MGHCHPDGTHRAGLALKLFPAAPEPGEPIRRERLSFRMNQPANSLHFARGANGEVRALRHSSPGGTLEVWETGPQAAADDCSPAL